MDFFFSSACKRKNDKYQVAGVLSFWDCIKKKNEMLFFGHHQKVMDISTIIKTEHDVDS